MRFFGVMAAVALIGSGAALAPADAQTLNARPGAPQAAPQGPKINPRPAARSDAPHTNERSRRSADSTTRGFEPLPPSGRLGTGTGFYVNATDIITNAHVVEHCSSMRDADGTRLRLVKIDHEVDLALLRANSSSSAWLQLAAPDRPKLGAGVYVLGFPLYGELGRSVVVTRGVISSRTGYLGRRANFGLDALIRPGNSGGPVLDANGRVIGVAVAVLKTPGYRAEDAPKNVGFAVSGQALSEFLDNAGAQFDVSEKSVAKMSDGVPLKLEDSVRPILCD